MSAAIVNIPYVGAMSNVGTATLQTVQQEAFNFTGAANVKLSGSLSADIIGAFALSQETQTSGAVVLNVAMRNAALFKAALKTTLETVTVSEIDSALAGQYATAGAVGVDLEAYIVAWARQQIDADLASNTIGAAIEASEVQALAITDFSANAVAAAADMYDGLNAAGFADQRRLVATQLPSSRYIEGVAVDALPLIGGDKMVFRFIVTSTITVSENAQDLGGAGDGATAGAGPGVGSGYGVDNRVIELTLTKA